MNWIDEFNKKIEWNDDFELKVYINLQENQLLGRRSVWVNRFDIGLGKGINRRRKWLGWMLDASPPSPAITSPTSPPLTSISLPSPDVYFALDTHITTHNIQRGKLEDDISVGKWQNSIQPKRKKTRKKARAYVNMCACFKESDKKMRLNFIEKIRLNFLLL